MAWAVFAACALAAQGAGLAVADADDANPDELQDIQVIGRHVAGDSGPTTIIDGDGIARSGATTLDEVLQRLPVFGFQGVSGNQNSGGYGASFVDLRNLNFNRTLVLIDGRRVVQSGIQTDEAVDLANVPISLVERIEVMPYGSAPSYGADAVAGVVNVVLKHDLSGGSVSASTGAGSEGGGTVEEAAASYGKDLEAGNISFALTGLRRQPIDQYARTWARDPIDTATRTADGQLELTRGGAASLAGNAQSSTGPVGIVTAYDPSTASYLRPGLRRGTANLLAHYEVAPSLTVFMEGMYSDRVAYTRLPPQSLGLDGTLKNPDGFVIPASNVYNSFGEEVTLQRVLGEVGDQDTRSDNRLARWVLGLEGTLAADVNFSVSLDHGDSRTTYSESNAVNLTRALQTVGDPALCLATPGCAPGDYFGAGSLSAAAANYIRFQDVTHSRYTENVVQGSVEGAFEVLSQQPWRTTLGVEYRTEQGETMPDPVVLAGDQAGGDSAVTSGGYNTREIFATADLPLLRDAFMAQSLAANASARYVDTNLFGHFPVWQFGLTWSPIQDLRVRGRVGTARRIPAITEAFGGSTTSPLAVTDPCDGANGLLSNPTVAANCRSLGLSSAFRQTSALIAVANGGSTALKPEFSRSIDVGAVFTPSMAGDFGVSIDYYKFLIHNAIDSLSDADPSYIPEQCYTSVGLTSPLCKSVVRIQGGPSAGQISLIEAPDQNIGAIATDGVDVNLDYSLPMPGAGTLSVDWDNTLLLNYRVQETPTSAYIQEAGTFPNIAAAGSLTRFKSLLSLAYKTDRWSASWTVRYIGGATVLGEDPAAPFACAPGIWYHDLDATFHHGRVLWRVGVDNVANQRPPTLVDGLSNTNLNTYDVIGRFLYARVTLEL